MNHSARFPVSRRLAPSTRFAIIASFGGFVFGFDASVISGAIGFISAQFGLSEWQQGMVVSAPTLGAIIASFFAAQLSDHLGRRNTLIGVALLYFISAFFSALAPSYEALVAARLLGGLAFCSLLITPMYIAEISLPVSRGKLVSINQLNIVLGLSVSYFSNYYILGMGQNNANSIAVWGLEAESWRWMLGLEMLPALIWFVALFTVPKSPRWLVLKNKKDDAKQVLTRLFSSEEANKQLSEINQIKEHTTPLITRLKNLVSQPYRFPLAMGLVLAVAQQISGINVVFFYAPSIFEQSGISTNAAFAQASWIGVVNVLFTIVALVTIDQFGRKPLLVIGLSGVCISMLLCSYGFKQASYRLTSRDIENLTVQSAQLSSERFSPLLERSFNSEADFKSELASLLSEDESTQFGRQIVHSATKINTALVLFGITFFVASFAMSLGPVMWVFFSEIFPSELRSIGIAVLAFVNGIVSFLVQLVFPWELANLGPANTFLIYAFCSFIALGIIMRFLPETKGRLLEQRISNNL